MCSHPSERAADPGRGEEGWGVLMMMIMMIVMAMVMS